LGAFATPRSSLGLKYIHNHVMVEPLITTKDNRLAHTAS
jgi:hypothetical protein